MSTETIHAADVNVRAAELLPFLANNKQGIFVAFASLFALAFLIQWIAWVFGWGRFGRDSSQTSSDGQSRNSIRLVVADLFVKVIDDFRHLLALLIIVLFAIALLYVLIVTQFGASIQVDSLSKAMQAVTGSLGGIIGVILGYYFGESAGRGGKGRDAKPTNGGEPEQDEVSDDDPSGGSGEDLKEDQDIKSPTSAEASDQENSNKTAGRKRVPTKRQGIKTAPPPPPPKGEQ